MAEQNHIILIKNMVCNRCVLVVTEMLKGLHLTPLNVELGKAVVQEELKPDDWKNIKEALEKYGFEWIDDKRMRIIEQIRTAIIELVHYGDNGLKTNLSDYLASKLYRDYSALSKLFSETTNTTIEKYLIAQKIERAKELLMYGELSLNEIADMLNYSSVSYLSAQFKHVTGMTPSHFKKIKGNKRKPLDEI